MIAFHLEGGIEYMAPLAVMLIVNLILIGLAVYGKYVKRDNSMSNLNLIHHISMLALVWGVFGTVNGLFAAFGSLAEIEEAIPLQAIMGGLKVALITALYGMIIFMISRIALLMLKSGSNSSPT